MTNLTEQWEKGELPSGYYYVYLKYLKMFDTVGTSTLSGILERGNGDNIEVLAEVPSYDEWDKLNNACHELEKETAYLTVDIVKLKELLKECRDELDTYYEPTIKKINQVLGEE